MDYFIIAAALIMIIFSEFLIRSAKKKDEQWQEQNKDLIKKYSRSQLILIIVFVVFLTLKVIELYLK